jgi:acyl-CoA synthetase (AMP-forming)/AMP-acid ligase II
MAGSGAVTTYAQLAERSGQGARLLQAAGLQPGDHVAFLLENHERFFELVWAALRCGLYATPISTWLGAEEATAVVADTGARALVATPAQAEVARDIAARLDLPIRLAVGGAIDGFESYDDGAAGLDGSLLDEEPEGSMMLYSSGTTSRPKGVRRPLSGGPAGTANPLTPFLPHVGLDASTVYLSPGAPLYHAAQLGWCLGALRMGGTAVVLERFDPEAVLAAVERHRVTLVQVVPTMLIRLLRLPPDVRRAYDLASLRTVLHAAAPCPPDVKRDVIEWLGPIVDEYYSGTEGSGITYVTSEEWLQRPGTVGRPILGEIHVTDEDGDELGPGEDGTIWFSAGGSYEYHGDPDATARRRDQRGWTTLDDIGHVDADGYLFLTDRRDHMIVSGGVNISPQEAEDVLVSHPLVADAAVIGVPNADLGEEVKAVVVLVDPAAGDDDVADELLAACRARLARNKCPRSIDFVAELPRLPTGKLAKRLLRDRYWAGHTTRIV